MTSCANCQNDAAYTYTIVDGYSVNFCDKHLPTYVRKFNLATPFVEPTPVVEPAPVDPAPQASKKNDPAPSEDTESN